MRFAVRALFLRLVVTVGLFPLALLVRRLLLVTLALLLLLLQLLEQVAVVGGIRILGIQLEHLLVGIDRGLEFALARHRIAQVVETARIALLCKRRRTPFVVASAILRNGTPVCVFEEFHGFGWRPFFEQLLRLLVLGQPKVIPGQRLCFVVPRRDDE